MLFWRFCFGRCCTNHLLFLLSIAFRNILWINCESGRTFGAFRIFFQRHAESAFLTVSDWHLLEVVVFVPILLTGIYCIGFDFHSTPGQVLTEVRMNIELFCWSCSTDHMNFFRRPWKLVGVVITDIRGSVSNYFAFPGICGAALMKVWIVFWWKMELTPCHFFLCLRWSARASRRW